MSPVKTFQPNVYSKAFWCEAQRRAVLMQKAKTTKRSSLIYFFEQEGANLYLSFVNQLHGKERETHNLIALGVMN